MQYLRWARTQRHLRTWAEMLWQHRFSSISSYYGEFQERTVEMGWDGNFLGHTLISRTAPSLIGTTQIWSWLEWYSWSIIVSPFFFFFVFFFEVSYIIYLYSSLINRNFLLTTKKERFMVGFLILVWRLKNFRVLELA